MVLTWKSKVAVALNKYHSYFGTKNFKERILVTFFIQRTFIHLNWFNTFILFKSVMWTETMAEFWMTSGTWHQYRTKTPVAKLSWRSSAKQMSMAKASEGWLMAWQIHQHFRRVKLQSVRHSEKCSEWIVSVDRYIFKRGSLSYMPVVLM